MVNKLANCWRKFGRIEKKNLRSKILAVRLMIIKMNDKMIPFPPELQTMYDETPGLSVNNSRQIIRETWANAMEKYEKTRDARRVVSYLKRKLGVTIDYDDKYDPHREPDYFKVRDDST